MVKPYCWVVFPKLNDNSGEAILKMESTIQSVLDAYDAPFMRFNREDEFKGSPNPLLNPITVKDQPTKNDQVSPLGHIFEDLHLHFEQVDAEELSYRIGVETDHSLVL
jgi:hypothetical protein